MHTISACGSCNVETIVDEQLRRAASCDRRRECREFVKHTRAQRLFTDLNERDRRRNRSFDQPQNV